MDPDITNMDDPDFSEGARLEPEKIAFRGKDKLRKNPTDLTDTQVEYLSVAYLEKDLSPEQLEDLEIKIRENLESRIIFETVQKTKLIPPEVRYSRKASLKKLTAGQKVFRIVSVGLSAAATIAALIMGYYLIPRGAENRNDQQASVPLPDTTPVTFIIEKKNPVIAKTEKSADGKKRSYPLNIISNIPSLATAENNPTPELMPDNTGKETSTESFPLSQAMVPAVKGIVFLSPDMFLTASNNSYTPLYVDEERSRLRKSFASTFREKVLKEKFYTDGPLKPIEIARAGVDGLNKLLDWKMELRETRNDEGAVKSVYFSSALLTFNAPVKKTNE